jgi:hypothetical protein
VPISSSEETIYEENEMLKYLCGVLMISIYCSVANASLPTDDVAMNMTVIEKDFSNSQMALIPEEKPKSMTPYLRRTVPFILSGSAAIIELVLLITRTTNSDAILAATSLWFGANIAGLGNIYLDFKAK